jgi:hypothetical protein
MDADRLSKPANFAGFLFEIDNLTRKLQHASRPWEDQMKPNYVPVGMTFTAEQIAEVNQRIDMLCNKLNHTAHLAFYFSAFAKEHKRTLEFLDRLDDKKWSKNKAKDLARAIVCQWMDLGNNDALRRETCQLIKNELTWQVSSPHADNIRLIASRFWLSGSEIIALLAKIDEVSAKES